MARPQLRQANDNARPLTVSVVWPGLQLGLGGHDAGAFDPGSGSSAAVELAGGYSLTLYLLGLGICLVGLYTFTTGPDTAMLGWPLLFLGVAIIAVAMAESNAYRQHRYGEK